ncbi:MAG: hypothetical protein RIR62_2667, partial [Pseudomonadota bacterium]
MRYAGLDEFLRTGKAALAKSPVCILYCEDEVEVETTIRHHRALGFREVLVLAPPALKLRADLEDKTHRIDHDVHGDDAMRTAINRIAAAAPDIWFYYCFNAEYLFFPFCETRNVVDLLAFHAEERRDAMLTYVIDLYATDLSRYPNAVSLDDAHLDRSGYYALARKDEARNWEPKERQLDFYGGLRWRFEEHVPWTRRKIDRIAIFKAKRGLELREDFTFTDEEYNTYACPWHNNLTAAVCSFRTAKALKSNPG